MSELNAKPRARGASLFWPAYMLSWAVLAGGALSYLSLNAMHPSFQEMLGTPPQSNQESNRAEIDRAQLTAQVRSLNETVASLRSDLDKFKQQQEQQIARATAESEAARTTPAASDITTSSVQKPESRPLAVNESGETVDANAPTTAPPETVTSSQPASTPAPESGLVVPNIVNAPPASEPATATAPVANEPAASKPQRRRNLATSPLRPGRVPPLPLLNAQAPGQQTGATTDANPFRAALLNETNRQIKTASIPGQRAPQPPSPTGTRAAAAQPTTFGTPTVTQGRTTTPAALSLSTAQSVTGLRASWLLLTSRHPSTFDRLQPLYLSDQANGTYRLLAGPILTHAEADRICTELRAQGVSCGVTTYAGSALQ